MSKWSRWRQVKEISASEALLRRYFVVNGFDGALTMLGILSGFAWTAQPPIDTLLGACIGASVALLMSGLSSAYISESAERQRELADIEKAMGRDLQNSDHGFVARWTPWLVGMVNGFSPFLISLLIMQPLLWRWQLAGFGPVDLALLLGFICIFLLGVFLARISAGFWIKSGLKALAVGIMTMVIIQLVN